MIALPTVMEVLANALCMPTATSVTSDTAQLYGTVSRDGYRSEDDVRAIAGGDAAVDPSACTQELTQYGGHHQAAGLTLPAELLPKFTRRFREYVAQKLRPEDYLPHQAIDCVLSGSSEISIRDLEQLALLEPCGCENQ